VLGLFGSSAGFAARAFHGRYLGRGNHRFFSASIGQRLGERVHFWPFDGWDIPVGRSAIAEVYPRLWSRGFAPENRTGDQHDAYSIAAWLQRADHDGSLAAFLKPVLTPSERTVAQVEGWILGVCGRDPVLDHDRNQSHERH